MHSITFKRYGGYCGSFDDENYPKRLQDKFGSRWNMKALVQGRRDDRKNQTGKLTEESRKIYERSNHRRASSGHNKRKATKVVQLFLQAIPGGKTLVVEADTPVDVPRFRMAHADQFKRPWHLAAWFPTTWRDLLS